MNGFGRMTVNWPVRAYRLRPPALRTPRCRLAAGTGLTRLLPRFENSTSPRQRLETCLVRLRIQRTKKKRNFLMLYLLAFGCMYAARRFASNMVFSTSVRKQDRRDTTREA
jgi:hypothetical protein